MRKCIRCNAEMIEGLRVRTNDGYGLSLREEGFFKGSLGKLVAAACPECGYVETYISETDKLKNIARKG